MVTKLIGVKEFRKNMAHYLEQSQKHRCRYILINHNKPMAEVKSLTERELILEKLAADIAEARAEARAGHAYPLETALKMLNL